MNMEIIFITRMLQEIYIGGCEEKVSQSDWIGKAKRPTEDTLSRKSRATPIQEKRNLKQSPSSRIKTIC